MQIQIVVDTKYLFSVVFVNILYKPQQLCLMLTLVLCEGQTWNPVTRSNDIWGQDYIWEAICLQWSNSPSDKFYQREKSSCKQRRIPFPKFFLKIQT